MHLEVGVFITRVRVVNTVCKCCMVMLMVRRKNECNFLYECESVLESGYEKCGCCDMNEE